MLLEVVNTRRQTPDSFITPSEGQEPGDICTS